MLASEMWPPLSKLDGRFWGKQGTMEFGGGPLNSECSASSSVGTLGVWWFGTAAKLNKWRSHVIWTTQSTILYKFLHSLIWSIKLQSYIFVSLAPRRNPAYLMTWEKWEILLMWLAAHTNGYLDCNNAPWFDIFEKERGEMAQSVYLSQNRMFIYITSKKECLYIWCEFLGHISDKSDKKGSGSSSVSQLYKKEFSFSLR